MSFEPQDPTKMKSTSATPEPLLAMGTVRHTRLRPTTHSFVYPTCFLHLPLRAMRARGAGALARNRWAPLAFHDRDHGEGGPDCLDWIESLLAREGIAHPEGEIWLQCYPRVLGHTFKPVSFWLCVDTQGRLAAAVAEVNNTFGERHIYLLDGPDLGWGREVSARKVFHVSPFCEVQGEYRFRFQQQTAAQDEAWAHRTVVRVEHHDKDGPLLITSLSGTLAPATRARQRHALWRHPLLTLGVVARIHWQALQLWRKRVPFFRKPPAPLHALTRPSRDVLAS